MTERSAYLAARIFSIVTILLVLAGCNPSGREMQIDPVRAYMDARHALLAAAEDPDPKVRTHALESLAQTKDPAAGAIVMQALRSDPAPVLFAAVMAAGDLRHEPAKPLLLAAAKHEKTPPKLMCAIIYALHRLGDDTYTGQLGKLLHDQDKWVRATAAMIMGKLGEPSAVGPLKTLQSDDYDPVVQLQVVQALAMLGDERSIALLEAFTKSQYIEDRIIAAEGLGRISHRRSLNVLRKLFRNRKQDPTVRVAAAASLARLGEPIGYDLALWVATKPEAALRKARGRKADIRPAEVTGIQTMAVLALGDMGNFAAVDRIHPLLRSPRGAVRVAAGRAILQLLKAYRPVGLAPPPAVETRPRTRRTARPVSRPRLHTSGGKD